jgi:hypothetical protein
MGLFGAILGGVVGFFVGGPVGAAIGAGLGATKVGEKIINKVMDFVLKPFLGDFGMPQGGADAAREEGILITKRGGGSEQIPVIYGFRQVGGIITFATTGSDRNRYLWVAYVLSEGPVEGIHALYIDDNDVTQTNLIAALNRGEQVDITSGKYSGRVKMQFWYGKNFGTAASSSPVGANVFFNGEAPGWRGTDAYNGLATLFIRYEWKQVTTQEEADNNPFGGNIPNIKVNLLGRRVLPIDATTAGQTYIEGINAGRERYSTNPAEIIADYLRNPWYGKGLSNSEIDWLSFQTARDKYNTDVTYVNGVRGPILTTNCVLDSGVTLMGNIKTLLQGCRSYMPYVQGKYKLKVEDAGNDNDITSGSATVVKTFTSDNIVGDISYGGVPRDSVYSEYEVTYVDPNSKWATNTVVYPVTEAERIAYQVIDGGRVNKGSTTFSTITNYAMAYDMARLLFNKSRQQETLNVKVTSEAFDLEPGDNIQVQGNTLTFVVGEDAIPWRVISIKANDDYTFDLGCVRNPDTIYPHTRAGERDIIIPPYIPRYESIDYPTTDVDLSLYPPSSAYTGGQAIVSPLDPPGATDPTGSTGGGVGDQNGEQNQNPITVPPTPAPPVREVFNHYIQIDQVDYVINNNLVTATLTWNQPDSPSYAGVDFWYKRSIPTETNYRTSSNLNVPGSRQTITHSISGLIKGAVPYILYTRVKYTNGNSSTFRTQITLNVDGIVSTENPTDYEADVGSGWTLPTGSTVNPRDTIFSALTGTASLDGSNNRILSFNITQDINNPSGFNGNVSGMNIYYKLSSDTYYKISRVSFDGSYFPGQPYAVPVTLDLGVGNPTPDDASDNFDFIFRLKYGDGTESTKQWRYMGVDIQPTAGFANVYRYYENSIDHSFQTEEQAPPGSVVDTRNVTIGLTQVGWVLANPSQMYFNIQPPNVSNRANWYGVRVRYRKVPLAGGTVAFDRVDAFPVPVIDGIWQIKIGSTANPIEYDPTEYQIILTPVVRYSGSVTEASTSWIGQGRLIRDSANHFTRFNFKTIESAKIPEIAAQPFTTATPIALVKNWIKIRGTNTGYAVNFEYHQLDFNVSHVSGLTGVRIYRRSNLGNSAGPPSATTAKHFGLGIWEYIDVNTGVGGNATTLANGDIRINLRYPIDHFQFDQNFGITATASLLRQSPLPWPTGKIVSPSAPDIIIVVYTSAGPSPKGQLLRKFATNQLTMISPYADEILDLNAYNGYTAGYLRNISNAVPSYTTNLRATSSVAYSAPTANPGVV